MQMQPLTNNGQRTTMKDKKTIEIIRKLDYSKSDDDGIKLPVSYFSSKNKTKPETIV